MARKLKVFQASLGFYDQAIAAPSMKAAVEAWGTKSNLFHQGIARESSDPEVVAATMSKPGVILRRPVGSDGPFKEHADLPTNLSDAELDRKQRKRHPKPNKQSARTIDGKAAHMVALAFEEEERRRQRERDRVEAVREKERERRRQAIEKAQAALERAEREHDSRAATIEAERVPSRDPNERTNVGRRKGRSCRTACVGQGLAE
jgi:hypothetical protein